MLFVIVSCCSSSFRYRVSLLSFKNKDINECDEMGSLCAFRCQNTPGSFKCTCPYGYTLAADGRHCEDLDECRTPANDCRFDCKNLIGSFMCICPDGYEQVGMVDDCQDINECRINPGICSNGRCINTRGSYRCECFDGFQPSHTQKECIDVRTGFCYSVPSCTTQSRDITPITKIDCCCGMGAAWGSRCELCPLKGSKDYGDLCPHGVGFDKDGRDVDECSLMNNLCLNGRCINTLGSFRCICNKGYKPDESGTRCVDVNECELTPAPCKFTCQNTEGSFRCSCPDGYILAPDGITCRDIDECKTGQHDCQNQCVNTIGSYQCSCQKGFNQVGGQCIDINECTDEPHLCTPMGTCMNMPGSFKCLCQRGFSLDPSGRFCMDTNECVDDSRCQHGCENMVGGFRCACPEGFRRHYYWNQCVDENECSSGSVCGSASCENTIGSYSCSCPPGYVFDGNHMLCIALGASAACQNSPCSYGCTPTGPQGYSCNCPNEYQHLGQGHCFSTVSATSYGSGGQILTPGLGNLGSSVGNLDNSLLPLGSNLHIPDESSYSVSGDKIISTEGCYSCKLNSNNRQKRDASNVTRMNFIMRRQQKGSKSNHAIRRMEKKQPNRLARGHSRHHHHHQHSEIRTSNITDIGKGEFHVTVFVPLNKMYPSVDLLKIQPSVKYLRNNERFHIIDGNKDRMFEISIRQGIAVLHTRDIVQQPGVHILRIRARVENMTPELSTFDPEPFYLTVHLIITK